MEHVFPAQGSNKRFDDFTFAMLRFIHCTNSQDSNRQGFSSPLPADLNCWRLLSQLMRSVANFDPYAGSKVRHNFQDSRLTSRTNARTDRRVFDNVTGARQIFGGGADLCIWRLVDPGWSQRVLRKAGALGCLQSTEQ
jgi:hypothetical protein